MYKEALSGAFMPVWLCVPAGGFQGTPRGMVLNDVHNGPIDWYMYMQTTVLSLMVSFGNHSDGVSILEMGDKKGTVSLSFFFALFSLTFHLLHVSF